MILQKKTLRYYYWLALAFVQKHLKMILLSFFISLLVILSLISFSPYLDALFSSKTSVVGVLGSYDLNSLPDSILNKISYGLVYVDPTGNIRPAIASNWEILNKGKEFRFHLKDGLVWDDGKEFSANDISYNFRDVVVKAIDNRTIYFTLKKPLAVFPEYLTKPIIRYPLHGVVGDYRVDKVHFDQGFITELSLTPTKKDLPAIVYKFYDSESKIINAYKLGQITEMNIYKKSVADAFKNWNNSTVSKTVDYTTALALFFNLKKQTFDDKDIRQAFSAAINRDQLKDYGELANGPISPISWAYNTNIKKSVYDPDQAKKDLKKSFSASDSAKLTITTYYDYLTVAGILERNFKDASVPTDVTLSNETNPENYDVLLAFWKIPADPDQYFYWHSTQMGGGNITGYKNVRIDKLLEDGRSTLSPRDRKPYYLDFQKVFADEIPAIFLYYPYTYTIKRK